MTYMDPSYRIRKQLPMPVQSNFDYRQFGNIYRGLGLAGTGRFLVGPSARAHGAAIRYLARFPGYPSCDPGPRW
jgi:hypothetical protein